MEGSDSMPERLQKYMSRLSNKLYTLQNCFISNQAANGNRTDKYWIKLNEFLTKDICNIYLSKIIKIYESIIKNNGYDTIIEKLFQGWKSTNEHIKRKTPELENLKNIVLKDKSFMQKYAQEKFLMETDQEGNDLRELLLDFLISMKNDPIYVFERQYNPVLDVLRTIPHVLYV